MSRVVNLDLGSFRSMQQYRLADALETCQHCSLAKTLLYLGQAVLPQACFKASKMQQRLRHLTVCSLITVIKMVSEFHKLHPLIFFCRPPDINNITITTITDASHCGKNVTYGQTGLVNGLKVDSKSGSWFHPNCWSSARQQKIVFLRLVQRSCCTRWTRLWLLR